MPLIRYRNDDVAIASPESCSCGRGLPLLASVAGRVLDMIVGPDGQVLAGEFFPHLLKDYATIARYQVHQDRARAITVKLLPAPGFQPDTARDIEHRIRLFLGAQAALRVQVVDEIPLTKGGKHRFTVSEARLDLA
jgi:phenylacetate-CoA ligase